MLIRADRSILLAPARHAIVVKPLVGLLDHSIAAAQLATVLLCL